MNKKKQLVLQVLKERVNSMQEQINILQRKKSQIERRTPSKSLSKSKEKASPIRKTSTNQRYKSPTFWTGNPILGDQNPYSSVKEVSPKKLCQRNTLSRQKSPILQKIKKDIDLTFYQSAPQQFRNKQNLPYFKGKSPQNPFKRHQTQIYYFRNTPKVQKKKTYDIPKKNPILNPEPPKPIGRRIINKNMTFTSGKMFIQNPNSNPNLYFYQTQPIKLSPKPHNNRNISPDLRLLLSNSTEDLRECNSTSKSSKKHYGKYYEENLLSKWNVNW